MAQHGSQVIDDSTIGGRWKTRLSESLPDLMALNISRASGSCSPHLCWWHPVPYCAEHSQKPWPSAMLDRPLEVQWLVPPEQDAIRKFVPAHPGYNNYRTAIHLKNGARISLDVGLYFSLLEKGEVWNPQARHDHNNITS
ncbi:conserved hypothetical protein [Ricinus communis]|uniref:Uncharacterized protein n=1 Tax=Ricinus communis TaxID=3988 RepID=B9TCL0_RICCO|nr:conserved hypothetical protein [Ricinus communis]